MAKKLTATHSQILRILANKSCSEKHIHYVIKCLGYKDYSEIDIVFSCLKDLKNRHLVDLAQQFHFDHETGKSFTIAQGSRWWITDKGKDFLEVLET